MYISHMRSEGNKLLEAIDELIEISRQSGAPAEIYHFKQGGKPNWGKIDAAIAHVEAARASGQRITADMYTYTAGATGLDAAMPTWVQSGGLEAWIKRMKDPAVRARLVKEMRTPSQDWENLLLLAGQPRQGAADRVQEPEAEAAHRQDPRRGGEDARQEPRGNRDGPGHRGRQPRRHGLFPDERGQREARGRAAVDELRLGRGARKRPKACS